MAKQFDVVGKIIAYESGEMEHEEIVEFFQHLVNTGMAWQLQGSYGRAAMALIAAGEITQPAPKKAKKKKTFRVRWEIDIEATTPRDAAVKALEIQRDPESIATVFEIEGLMIDLFLKETWKAKE